METKKISFTFISTFVLSSYFLISALNGFTNAFFARSYMSIYLLLIVVFSFKHLLSESKVIDWLFLLFVLLIISSSLMQNYESELFSEGIRYIPLLLCFLLGRGNLYKEHHLFKYGIYVYVIVSLIGLYLFFTMPAWYLDFKMDGWYINDSESRILEMMRLSAFWQYPYWISYGGAIFFTYIICNSFKKINFDKKNVILLVFISLIVILAQQRVAILWIVILIMTFALKNVVLDKKKYILPFFVILFVLGFILFSFLSDEFIGRFIYKFDALSEDNFLKRRSDLFSFVYDKEISFFGDGIGRYGHKAFVLFRRNAITDQGYLKILHENGIFGIIGFSLLILYSTIVGVHNFKNNLFEIFVVIFFLISMMGSNSIFMHDTHALVFWLCLGRLSNVTRLKKIIIPPTGN